MRSSVQIRSGPTKVGRGEEYVGQPEGTNRGRRDELRELLRDYRNEGIFIAIFALVATIFGIAIGNMGQFTRGELILTESLIALFVFIVSLLAVMERSISLSTSRLNGKLTALQQANNAISRNILLLQQTLTETNENLVSLRKAVTDLSDKLKPDLPANAKGALRRLIDSYAAKEAKLRGLVSIENASYTVEKQDVYIELISFARVMFARDGDSILAISSVNTEDWEHNPMAENYLAENKRCVDSGVPVRRIFFVSETQLDREDALSVVRKHAQSLDQPTTKGSSGVKWLSIKDVPSEDSTLDLAIFNNCILVRTIGGGGRFNVTINNDEAIKDAEKTFEKYWAKAKSFKELVVETERRKKSGRS